MRNLRTRLGRASGTTRAIVIAAAVAAAGAFALIPLTANRGGELREIVLVARDMAFYVEGSAQPNPTLVVKRGEAVRLVLRNQEPGVTHDLAIASLRTSVDPIHAGSTASVTLTAPDRPGRHEYVCRPHAEMMRGQLLVVE